MQHISARQNLTKRTRRRYIILGQDRLSLPLTICTLDQIFRFVFLYRGFEERLATLSYSKVIIDEVQMYSPSLIAYLVVGLSYITKLGGHFAILTATLPSFVPDLLREQGISFEPQRVFVDDTIRHSIKVLEKPINAQDIFSITEQYGATKILVICNTIKAATAVFKQLQDLFKGRDVHLLHSGFIRQDREAKETEITITGKKAVRKVASGWRHRLSKHRLTLTSTCFLQSFRPQWTLSANGSLLPAPHFIYGLQLFCLHWWLQTLQRCWCLYRRVHPQHLKKGVTKRHHQRK